MPLATVELDLDEVGIASRIVVDGRDITDRVTAVEVRCAVGELTKVTLTMLAEVKATVRGDVCHGIAESTTLGSEFRTYTKRWPWAAAS